MIAPVRIVITSLDYAIEAEGTHPGTRDAIFGMLGISSGICWQGLDSDLLRAFQAMGAVQIARAAALNGVMPSIVLRTICDLASKIGRKLPKPAADAEVEDMAAELPVNRLEATTPIPKASRKAPPSRKKAPTARQTAKRG